MTQSLTITPPKITDKVLALCRRLDPSREPVYVPVRPFGSGIQQNCFFNVEYQVKKSGGRNQLGWIIWEMPNVLLEAEFHAVWEDSEGQLIDITPQPDGEETVLFLPDTTRTYNREPVDNVRVPLRNNEIVDEFIRLHERYAEIINTYMVDKVRPGGFLSSLPPQAVRELQSLDMRFHQIGPKIERMAKGRQE